MIERPRLFLITPRLDDAAAFAAKLEAAVGAADVACVLLRTAARDAGAAKAIVRALAPIAQKRGAAVLVEDDARLAVRAEADGVHLAGEAALDDALGALKPDRIVGIGALADRDAAMRAGETGVDYLMFGGPDDPAAPDEVAALSAWWAEIFNVPCVAYAHSPEVAGALAETGVEFVALCDGLWEAPDIAEAVRAADLALARVGETAE
jgi:thiamine-phosphate pyrophosphorylase